MPTDASQSTPPTRSHSPSDSETFDIDDLPSFSTFPIVEHDDLGSLSPAPLPETVSLASLLDLSTQGPQPADAERFTQAFAVLIMDGRDWQLDRTALVEQLVSASMTADDKTFLENDLLQRETGLLRHIDMTVPSWIRSEYSEEGDSATIGTHMISFVRADGLDGVGFWVRLRLDATWAGDAWRLDRYLNAAASFQLEPTRADLDRFFDGGVGWRHVPLS